MDLDELVERALAEDVGAGDVTTLATVGADATGRALITQKQSGVIYGLDVATRVFQTVDTRVSVEPLCAEGKWRDVPPAQPVLAAVGPARALLTAERTALNFLQRLSGIATATALAVRQVAGTGAQVLDTRKTTPGLRMLEKAAVAAGGGTNHRLGLFDAILIKENHAALAGGVAEAVRRARNLAPHLPVEVEVRDMDELEAALAVGADRLLCDNMTPDQLREAVRRTDGRAELEASGGVTVPTLKGFASTGVKFVSLGALTHSAPALDLSLALEAT